MKLSPFLLSFVLFVGLPFTTFARSGARKLEICEDRVDAADVVLLFDESGSMWNEQQTAAANSVTLFNEFKLITPLPRFAVGGFGRSGTTTQQRIREVTSDFVTSVGALQSALGSLVINGGYEEGFQALYDVFTNGNNPSIDWVFNNVPVCVIIFTDEDSDGPMTASSVNSAVSNYAYGGAIIPVVTPGQAANAYSQVSSLLGGATLDLNAFVSNPSASIQTIVDSCVTALTPEAVCKDVVVPHDGFCKENVNPSDLDGGSTDPNNDALTFTANPASPYYVSGLSSVTDVTLSVSDPEGNCDTCQAKVTVTNQGPTAACKDITRPVNDAACAWATNDVSAEIDNGSNDLDGILLLSVSDPGPFSGSVDLEEHFVTLTASDNCGVDDQCDAKITVTNAAPEALCQDIERAVDDECKWTPTNLEIDINNGSYDPEGFTVALSAAPPGPFYGGDEMPTDHEVTLTVEDICSATDTCDATVTVVDNTKPTATCVPSVNPAGNEPQANNQDGFFELGGDDNCEVAAIYVVDSGSGEKFGPFPPGTIFKYTEAPGAKPTIREMNGAVDWKIKGKGDAYVLVEDISGNQSDRAWCLVPPPPARNLRGLDN